MTNSKKIILFDIDHTLFDTTLYQSICYQRLLEITGFTNKDKFLAACKAIYSQLRKNSNFKEAAFVDALTVELNLNHDHQELIDVFNDRKIIDRSIYADADRELEKLAKTNTILGIFSAGLMRLQRAKIELLLKHFSQEHIYINEVDKKQDIPRITAIHKNDDVFVIDDLTDVLYSLKSQSPLINTIQIKRDGWYERAKIAPSDFRPDYEIMSLEELQKIIN